MFKSKQKDFEVISDVDAVVAKPVGFKLHGKTHRIEPITTQKFFEWSGSLASIYALKDKKDVTPDEIVDCYFNVIHSLCETVTREDIKKCEQAQLAALYGLIFDHCTGRAHTEEYQKKKTRMMEKTQEMRSKSLN